MTIFSFLIGFVAGAFIAAHLAIKKAETHDFTLVEWEIRWGEHPG